MKFKPWRSLLVVGFVTVALVTATPLTSGSGLESGPGSEGPAPKPSDPGALPSGRGFPTASSAGLPAGWEPDRTVEGDYPVSVAGVIVQDLRIVGDLVISAPDVVVRRVEIVGGSIDNLQGSVCHNGLVIEDSAVRRGATDTTDDGGPSIGTGGYVADNVLIDGPAEGFRVGGKGSGCGPVVIRDSYVHVVAPDLCTDWHGDGIQGYGGSELTVRNSVLVLDERPGCSGTAAFFYPGGQGNSTVDIDGLVVQGGGYPFRLGTAGSVRDLNIVAGWGYGPLDVLCQLVTAFDARMVRLDPDGQPVEVRPLTC